MSNIRYVLSLDPGETTGMCVAGKQKDENGDVEWSILQTAALKKNELYSFIESFVMGSHKSDELLVIYEQYKLYESKKEAMVNNEFETVQIIGVIKYICDRYNVHTIKSPTLNKAFWTNTRLKDMELYVKDSEHERDAIRHFLHWLYFTEKGADLKDVVHKK